MKKLFERNETTFAVVLIVFYVVGSSVMQSVSDAVGTPYLAEAAFNIVLTAILYAFVRKNGLMRHVGLCRSEVPAPRMLFYLPLALTGGMGALFGVGMQYGALVTALHTAAMLCSGFLEEVIFRGFLFKGIAKDHLKRAVIVSSLTFGLGHIVNLLFNRYELFDSVTQITYAVVVGFLLVFLFLRTGSLLACIAFHSFNNCMTAFTTFDRLTDALGDAHAAELVLLGMMIAVALAYLLCIVKSLPKRAIDA